MYVAPETPGWGRRSRRWSAGELRDDAAGDLLRLRPVHVELASPTLTILPFWCSPHLDVAELAGQRLVGAHGARAAPAPTVVPALTWPAARSSPPLGMVAEHERRARRLWRRWPPPDLLPSASWWSRLQKAKSSWWMRRVGHAEGARRPERLREAARTADVHVAPATSGTSCRSRPASTAARARTHELVQPPAAFADPLRDLVAQHELALGRGAQETSTSASRAGRRAARATASCPRRRRPAARGRRGGHVW